MPVKVDLGVWFVLDDHIVESDHIACRALLTWPASRVTVSSVVDGQDVIASIHQIVAKLNSKIGTSFKVRNSN